MEILYQYVLYSCLCLVALIGLTLLFRWTDGRISRKWRFLCGALLLLRISIPVDVSVFQWQKTLPLTIDMVSQTDEATGEADDGRDNMEKNSSGRLPEAPQSEQTQSEQMQSKQAQSENGLQGKEESSPPNFSVFLEKRDGYRPSGDNKISLEPAASWFHIEVSRAFVMGVGLLWLIGFLLLAVKKVIFYRLFQKNVLSMAVPLTANTAKAASGIAGDMVEEVAEPLKQELGLRQNIYYYASDFVASPLCTGIRKKKILLPCREYSREELYYILKHEMVHIARRDLEIKALLSLGNLFNWWNPVFRIISRRMMEDMEFICDEYVTDKLGERERLTYNQVLLANVEKACRFRLSESLGANREANITGKRMVLNMREKRSSVWLSVFMALVLMVSCFGTSCSRQEENPAMQTPQTKNEFAWTETKISLPGTENGSLCFKILQDNYEQITAWIVTYSDVTYDYEEYCLSEDGAWKRKENAWKKNFNEITPQMEYAEDGTLYTTGYGPDWEFLIVRLFENGQVEKTELDMGEDKEEESVTMIGNGFHVLPGNRIILYASRGNTSENRKKVWELHDLNTGEKLQEYPGIESVMVRMEDGGMESKYVQSFVMNQRFYTVLDSEADKIAVYDIESGKLLELLDCNGISEDSGTAMIPGEDEKGFYTVNSQGIHYFDGKEPNGEVIMSNDNMLSDRSWDIEQAFRDEETGDFYIAYSDARQGAETYGEYSLYRYSMEQ
ncbi:MAG: M56 family metallopeptidase [Lachnospiraceae bacterium]|nr:M56 family metallopeptidase [Lachnospiraceae bacterium]